jgi:hypothetical protein
MYMKIRLKAVVIFAFFIGFACCLYAQIGHGGMPYSFKKDASLQQVNMELLPYLDNRMLLENEIPPAKEDAFVFGKEIAVNYTLENSGLWESLPNGARLWRMGVQSTGAYSINLQFDRFFIPPSSRLFIYTEDRSYIIGSFTAENNNQWTNFATSLLPGDAIILEYYEAPQDYNKGEIQLSTVVHGYKDFFFKAGTYGSSQKCNVDVNCNTGTIVQTVKRAVAIILRGGGAHCSGTLLNNTKQDGTPYFLTANHCMGYNPSYFVFVFNYESEGCNQQGEKTTYSVNGATLLASALHSDFALLLLNNTLPQECHPYYAGWDRRNIAEAGTFSIHHPAGDKKKISIYTDNLVSSKYETDNTSFPNNTHWEVTKWSSGTTEGGSSGSGLFNILGQLVGQLEGGSAECQGASPNDGSDVFGKLSYSWTNENNIGTNRLDHWLDPIGSGTNVLDGYDPYPSVGVVGIETPSTTIRLYPNPADETIQLESDAEIQFYTICSLNGQSILSQRTNARIVAIHVAALAEGIYILSVQTKDGIQHEKLVIQH